MGTRAQGKKTDGRVLTGLTPALAAAAAAPNRRYSSISTSVVWRHVGLREIIMVEFAQQRVASEAKAVDEGSGGRTSSPTVSARPFHLPGPAATCQVWAPTGSGPSFDTM